jgi:hypothetical protein
MAVSENQGSRSASLSRLLRWVLGPLIVIPLGLFGLSWWLTEPLDEVGSIPSAPTPDAPPAPPQAAGSAGARPTAPGWSEGRLDGEPAKRLLLDTLLAVRERLNRVRGYTATFHKLERIDGKLGPEQTLAIKVRHRPFAIYFKFLAPTPGKEVVYAEGQHDNKLIAHGTGVARWLVPRLAVPPDHPLALAETRHSVTEAGLANLTDKLIGFRRMDLADPDAVTILDRTTRPEGREWLRSLHVHQHRKPGRPFARTEVLYDPEDGLPLQISNYDWPEPGHHGDLLLAERYAYDDLDLEADLTTLDFDPANPAYAFHRY